MVGVVVVQLFLIPRQSTVIGVSSENKNLAEKISPVLDKSVQSLPDVRVITNVIDDKTNTPGQTQKTSGIDEFMVTIQQPYFTKGDGYDTDFLKKVLIHELMHVISLQNSQFQTQNPSNFDPSDRKLFDSAEQKCLPEYFNSNGCLKSASYLSTFYKKFWTGEMRTEYDIIQQTQDKQQFSQSLYDWGTKYLDSFLSQNAFVSPEEDLAESFSFWALDYDTANLTQTQKDKIRFFDNYPELKSVKNDYLSSFDSSFKIN